MDRYLRRARRSLLNMTDVAKRTTTHERFIINNLQKVFTATILCVCVLQVTSNVLYKSPLSAVSDSKSNTLRSL